MYSRGKGRAASFVWGWFFVAIVGGLLLSGCGGGGGDDVEGPFTGGGGTGADGVGTFWRYFGAYGTNDVGTNYAIDIADDGFFVAGDQGRPSTYLIVKADAQGVVQWRLNGDGSAATVLKDIKKTPDGGAVAVGYRDDGLKRNVLVVKVDADGTRQWLKWFAVDPLEWDEAHAVCVLESGYAIAGGTRSMGHPHHPVEAWFLKLDPDGEPIPDSERFAGLPGRSMAYAMDCTAAGDFIIAGSGPSDNLWVALLDPDGQELWSELYGRGVVRAVRQVAPGNGFIVAGSILDVDGWEVDALAIRIDQNGQELWSKVSGGDHADGAYGAAVTADGDFILAGFSRSYGNTDDDFFLVKLDPNGNTRWQKIKGKSPQNFERAFDVVVAPDGGLVVAGTGPNILAKFDKNGHTVNLGDLDLTIDLPERAPGEDGLISMDNAEDIAFKAADMVMVPFSLASFPLDLLIDQLNSVPQHSTPDGELCDIGGGYVMGRRPSHDVLGGSSGMEGNNYGIFFDKDDGCTSSKFGDVILFEGMTGAHVIQVSGNLTSDEYEIEITAGAQLKTTVVAQDKTTNVGGQMQYSRRSIPGTGFEEELAIAENQELRFAEGGDVTIVQALAIGAVRGTTGQFAFGSTGQGFDLYMGLLDRLKVSVETPISGTNVDQPDKGQLRVEARDGSNLAMTFNNGMVTIAVDTTGDGKVDDEFEVQWD